MNVSSRLNAFTVTRFIKNPMDYSFHAREKLGIFTLDGNLIGERDGMAFAESFSEKLEEGFKDFVVDLAEMRHINSTGLGVLITLFTKARRNGGDLYLAQPTPFVNNLLLMTKLNTVFKIFPSVEDAVVALSSVK